MSLNLISLTDRTSNQTLKSEIMASKTFFLNVQVDSSDKFLLEVPDDIDYVKFIDLGTIETYLHFYFQFDFCI